MIEIVTNQSIMEGPRGIPLKQYQISFPKAQYQISFPKAVYSCTLIIPLADGFVVE